MLAVLDLVLISAFWGLGFSVLIGFRLLVWGFRVSGLRGLRVSGLVLRVSCLITWEFPKIRGTLFWGPCNKDPTM